MSYVLYKTNIYSNKINNLNDVFLNMEFNISY